MLVCQEGKKDSVPLSFNSNCKEKKTTPAKQATLAPHGFELYLAHHHCQMY